MRGLHQRDGVAAVELGQARLQQADFADARMRGQQFDQRALRPPAARQLRGQRGMAGGNAAIGAARQLRGAPEGGVDVFGAQHDGTV